MTAPSSLRPGVLVACLNSAWFMGGNAAWPCPFGPLRGQVYTVNGVRMHHWLPITMISLEEIPGHGDDGWFAFTAVRDGRPLWRIVQRPDISELRKLLAPKPGRTVREFIE